MFESGEENVAEFAKKSVVFTNVLNNILRVKKVFSAVDSVVLGINQIRKGLV